MKKLTLSLIIITSLLLLSIFPEQTEAHRGRLDKLGGHFRTADCVYELHKPTSLAKKAKTKSELVSLIKKYSSNKCKNTLTTSKLSLEGYKLGTGTAPKTVVPKGKIVINKKYTDVKLDKCVDGDTANFKINGKVYKTRFLFIDTPESTIQKEAFGKEAASYTCSKLKKAKKIVLETDGKDVYDKYDRLLAWVWIDGKLHQEMITKAGLVEGFYDYGTYKYESKIRSAMSYAKKNNKGMYK
ncbi:thermonuclease family protein [Bacillus sp. 31A1R]|uniref:Thermonuclease family protein n=1 Tax=Robertmurraya mangrovi TaxID=3098077 RepID=A0ABU5ITC1_9BACI|nr:thermonuclease family protein [Bacillus sp. 31A1R]MDZ5470407.1 thermonuclease family protein [Bacillus sp. 31A1R]